MSLSDTRFTGIVGAASAPRWMLLAVLRVILPPFTASSTRPDAKLLPDGDGAEGGGMGGV